MTLLKNILLWIWQAPQNIVGLVLRGIFSKGAKHVEYKGIHYVVNPKMPGGISLGNTVLVWESYKRTPDTWNHEWGHTRQSLMLGPLYLFIIGIPSITWALFYKYDYSDPNGYYRFYTEKWADKLGGVERK